jgi:hypothetical protein
MKVAKIQVTDIENPIGAQIDITVPKVVQIVIKQDGTVVWVNIDGICRLRACRIEKLEIEDQRKSRTTRKSRKLV